MLFLVRFELSAYHRVTPIPQSLGKLQPPCLYNVVPLESPIQACWAISCTPLCCVTIAIPHHMALCVYFSIYKYRSIICSLPSSVCLFPL